MIGNEGNEAIDFDQIEKQLVSEQKLEGKNKGLTMQLPEIRNQQKNRNPE